jgi:hypothetical protein
MVYRVLNVPRGFQHKKTHSFTRNAKYRLLECRFITSENAQKSGSDLGVKILQKIPEYIFKKKTMASELRCAECAKQRERHEMKKCEQCNTIFCGNKCMETSWTVGKHRSYCVDISKAANEYKTSFIRAFYTAAAMSSECVDAESEPPHKKRKIEKALEDVKARRRKLRQELAASGLELVDNEAAFNLGMRWFLMRVDQSRIVDSVRALLGNSKQIENLVPMLLALPATHFSILLPDIKRSLGLRVEHVFSKQNKDRKKLDFSHDVQYIVLRMTNGRYDVNSGVGVRGTISPNMAGPELGRIIECRFLSQFDLSAATIAFDNADRFEACYECVVRLYGVGACRRFAFRNMRRWKDCTYDGNIFAVFRLPIEYLEVETETGAAETIEIFGRIDRMVLRSGAYSNDGTNVEAIIVDSMREVRLGGIDIDFWTGENIDGTLERSIDFLLAVARNPTSLREKIGDVRLSAIGTLHRKEKVEDIHRHHDTIKKFARLEALTIGAVAPIPVLSLSINTAPRRYHEQDNESPMAEEIPDFVSIARKLLEPVQK